MKTAAKKKSRKAARRPSSAKPSRKRPAATRRPAARSDRSVPTAAPSPRRPAAKGTARRSRLVVDATNVLCGAQDRSRLDLVLSLVTAVAAEGADVLCIFDATTPHRLQTSPERDLYRWLLAERPRHFVQCPGRTEADLLILAEAERMGCAVVSNDFFRDREDRHPWVRDRGRVLRHQPIRDVLYLGDRPLPIENDLAALRRQVELLLA